MPGAWKTFSILLWLCSTSEMITSFLLSVASLILLTVKIGNLPSSFSYLQTAMWKTNEAITEAQFAEDTPL